MDTGDLLFSQASAQKRNARQIGNLRADLYMKVYNLMGYDAFTPGELDLSMGVGDLIRISQQANFPFLVANLVNATSKEPVFKPYVIKEVQGMKVGIFGLISNRSSLGGSSEEKGKFQITDPSEAAKKLVKALKGQCQLIVLLAHMEADEQNMLVENVRGIDFVINGHLAKAQAESQFVDNTQIFIGGVGGQFMGQIDFFRKDREEFDARYQLIPLKTDYAEEPQVRAWVGQYNNELQYALQPKGPISSPEIAGPTPLSFVGDKGCPTCHPREHEQWATTAHAHTYRTLADKNQASDTACLSSCHTTGFGSRRDPGGRYENVQCEACHGPAEGHPDSRKHLAYADKQRCRQCYNPTKFPDFNYDSYVQKVLHPKEQTAHTPNKNAS